MPNIRTNRIFSATLMLAVSGFAIDGGAQAQSDAEKMSFFITSTGPGTGGNLGGLEGADAYCTQLAMSAGSTKKWAAYLSTSMVIDRSQGRPYKITDGVSARDRIGTGPWHNAKGVLIAKDIDELHSTAANINKDTGLDENGKPINDRTLKPNEHDIITGSDSAGKFSTAGGDTTCGNWTKSAGGSAIVGHHDRAGLNQSPNMVSWNSSHASAGCGVEDFPKTGGAGLFYCFAVE